MQKIHLLLMLALVLLSCTSTRNTKWQAWKEDFRVMPTEDSKFVGVAYEKADFVTAYPRLDSAVIGEIGINRVEVPRAVGRVRLGNSSWWALVALFGPGEASSHWQYYLLPVDSLSGKVGKAEWLTEVVQECEGYLDACESWLQDIDGDGNLELVRRCLSYGIPNSGAEYCAEGYPPTWQTEVMSFQKGAFASCASCHIDSTKFLISEEARMREAFIQGGHADMLPRSAR